MVHDHIVEEVRRIRHKIEDECQNNAQKYYEHMKQLQEKYRERLVQRKSQPALKKVKTDNRMN